MASSSPEAACCCRCSDSGASRAKAVSARAGCLKAEAGGGGGDGSGQAVQRTNACPRAGGALKSVGRGCQLQETQCLALHVAKEWKRTSFLQTHLAFSQLHINFPLSHQALTVWPPLTDIGSSYLI